MPNDFTLTFFLLRRRDVSCSHGNRDLFTCEDNMLFTHVKISCFRAKAHLVFHWYLYNKMVYFPGVGAFEQLFGSGRGNLNINFPKFKCPGGCWSFDLTGTLPDKTKK